MSALLVRKGCAGYVEGVVGMSGQRMCGRCSKNRGIHRRWRVLDGGKNEEGTMTATSEAIETSASEQRRAAAIVGEAVLLSSSALVYVSVSDVNKWEAAKELAGDHVVLRLIVAGEMGERVCESFDLHRGALTLRAHGPSRPATMADFERVRAQREHD